VSQPAFPQEEPAATWRRVVDGDVHAVLLQEPGGGESDHSGTDDGDAL
jgi:hypothetical protein